MNRNDRQACLRAEISADTALVRLDQLKSTLKRSQNWAFADSLGSGSFCAVQKQARLRDAGRELELAEHAVLLFCSDLRTAADMIGNRKQTEDFLHFADYFFSGAVRTWLRQGRADMVLAQTGQAYEMIRALRRKLQMQ